MKKHLFIPVILLYFTACSSPFLKWIEDPADERLISKSDKAITAFSFSIEGEAVLIRTEADEMGKTPITVVLPANSNLDLSALTPAISYIGKSLSPGSGEERDFSNPELPVVYTVTAEDDSSKDYAVRVHIKSDESKRIIWFDLQIPRSGEHILAEGVISENEDGGEIVIYVPSGTDLSAPLTAHIAHDGESLLDTNGQEYAGTAVSLSAVFSAPATYKVKAGDGTFRDYLVTVIPAKAGAKEITDFSFDGVTNSRSVLIGSVPQPDGKLPIVVTVPNATDLRALKPVITHTGVLIARNGVPEGASGTVRASVPEDFSLPVTYTIQAEDGSVRDYLVTVYTAEQDNGKQITGFYFSSSNSPQVSATGIINETAKTIAVTVPYGTNLSSLCPIIYHTGESISPISGEPRDFRNSAASPVAYTVRAKDGTSQVYHVSVYVTANSAKAITDFEFPDVPGVTVAIGDVPDADGKVPIVITLPPGADPSALIPSITHTGTAITGDGIPAGGAGTVQAGEPVDFSGPVSYTIQAEDGSFRDYEITVIKTPDPLSPPVPADARIDAFYFNNPVVIGKINQAAKTITATVPYGTDLSTLSPVIHFTGASISQGGGSAHSENPAVIGADFSKGAVPYTVSAVDGVTTAAYQVTVSPGERSLSAAREITFFTFAEVDDMDTTAAISTTPDISGIYPAEIIIPAGTSLSSLTPIILYKGESISGAGEPWFSASDPNNPEITGVYAQTTNIDFTGPQPYRVTSEDGQTRDYVVTVRAEDNNAKIITGFYFTNPVAAGEINQEAHTITVTVPYGTNLSALTPTVYYTGASLNPADGRINNFTFPAVYTVSARNGTVQPYTVRVYPRQSSAKEITALSFPGVPALDTVIGSIPGPDGKTPISITVPASTDITALNPSISHTGQTISPGPGVRDFSGPVTYTVTAEDGSARDYAVSVHVSNDSGKVITGFSFNSVPAVGQIDQAAYTVTVRVPHGTDRSALSPTIAYIGASLSSGGDPPQTANPLTEAPRDFSAPRTYRVTARDGTVRDYTVTVSLEEQNLRGNVSFLGISDPGLLETNFDQNTGLITIRVKDVSGYTAPYEWYLDGQKYPVTNTEKTLILKVAGRPPGQHEVVLTATGPGGLHYTGKIYFLVSE
jgi:hypothetical protein